MKPTTVGIYLFFYLIAYCVTILIVTVLIIRFGVSLVYLFKVGTFYFSWEDDVLYSIKVGIAAGIPAGIGIWFMSWMKVRKEKQSPPKPKE
ncbi:hypothetical protein D781_1829 [Serratia sp. FGI94]|uniref:hypothetical protein n=1 Tax=Serratia sp. FGI94 TaxID=671990 RepID=UPI0002A713B6|nr:hypothetical protein [Serratia sp. FGI94]AGB82120.1 hypothetical protein D781_1829 [Serratia sp. FGI94]